MFPLNNKGIALVTSLMLSLITLVIIMSVFLMISNNMRSSAAHKVYKNATEAAYGGADLIMQDVIPRLFTETNATSLLSNYQTNLLMDIPNNPCVQQKLNNTVAGWTTAVCPGDRINPKTNYDVKFSLAGPQNQAGFFTVYSKIIDTIVGVQYPPGLPGGPLMGGGVAESSIGTTTNLNHYVYRIEITGERTTNPSEKSNLSLLYEY